MLLKSFRIKVSQQELLTAVLSTPKHIAKKGVKQESYKDYKFIGDRLLSILVFTALKNKGITSRIQHRHNRYISNANLAKVFDSIHMIDHLYCTSEEREILTHSTGPKTMHMKGDIMEAYVVYCYCFDVIKLKMLIAMLMNK